MNPSLGWAVFSTAGFYISFRYAVHLQTLPNASTLLPVTLSFIFLILLTVYSFRQPLERWIYLIAALVPLEFSAPLGHLPRLSPVDFICAISLICALSRLNPRTWIHLGIEIFGRKGFEFWTIFFIFASIDIFLTNGSFRPLLRWIEFLYAYALTRMALRETPGISSRLSGVFMWSCSAVSLLAISQFIISGFDYSKTYATFKQHNGFSAFLLLCLPALWVYSLQVNALSRILLRGLASMSLLAFLISFSRGAWLGLVGGILTVFFLLRDQGKRLLHHPRAIFLLVVGFFILAALVPLCIAFQKPTDASTYGSAPRLLSPSQRPLYWQVALSLTQSHPWLGIGPGNYEKHLPAHLFGESSVLYQRDLMFKHRNDFWQHLHSIYLQLLVEYGVIGFLLWALALSTLITPTILSLKEIPLQPMTPYFLMSIIGFSIHNSVDILFVSSLDLLFAFLLACTRPSLPKPPSI